MRLALLIAGLALVASCDQADVRPGIVQVETGNARFEIDAATLEIAGATTGGALRSLAAPAFDDAADASFDEQSRQRWTLQHEDRRYTVEAAADGNALVISVTAEQPGELRWPRSASLEDIAAYALPIFGEGKYIPATDALWTAFLANRADRHNFVSMSLPLWTELRSNGSLTWIVDPPYDSDLVFDNADGRLATSVQHAFSPLDPDAVYRVRLEFGPDDPVAGAKIYRRLLRDSGRFTSLGEKAAVNPNVRRLAGAPHIYLWESGPLKAGDITDWPGFLRRYAGRRDDANTVSGRIQAAIGDEYRDDVDTAIAEFAAQELVTQYQRRVVTRALNSALADAFPAQAHSPLPGGHDPYAQAAWIRDVRASLLAEFPGSFAPPERWGSGLSLAMIEALQDAEIKTAWLGAESWLDVLWHPEAAAAAQQAGYLLAAYDSYGSAHPSDLRDTWLTAQMGDDIYESAAYVDAGGSRVVGFADRGVYVNPLAIEDYARKRISAVAGAGELDSYFLDVDATGENFADYTERRRTSRRAVNDAFRKRIAFASETLGLVTGSEGGVSSFAQELHYAHGMTTVPFKWTNPAMKIDRDSAYFVGTYWPPETPDIFFRTTPLPEEQRRLFYAPEYRVPLYQVALHDSVVTTHHWEYPSTKFASEIDTTLLLEHLYMVPPLFHLSTYTLADSLPRIVQRESLWAPLHARLYDKQMTGFRFLSDDRLLQQTTFDGGVTITVNFSDELRQPDGIEPIEARSIRVHGMN